jgi:hypothetical protein
MAILAGSGQDGGACYLGRRHVSSCDSEQGDPCKRRNGPPPYIHSAPGVEASTRRRASVSFAFVGEKIEQQAMICNRAERMAIIPACPSRQG